MKKKFAAAFVACALAMAMPAAAFAATETSPEAEPVIGAPNTVAIDTTAQGNGMTGISITGKTDGVYANNFGTTQAASQENAANYADGKIAEKQQELQDAYDKAVAEIEEQMGEFDADIKALEAQKEALTLQLQLDKSAAANQWAVSEYDYNKAVNKFASIDGNSVINTFELQGDSKGSMTVTIVLDKSKYAGHTVTALILDENGKTIQKTLVVDKNGCIKIEKDGFCVWTLVDCSGGLPAGIVPENGVSSSDFEKALDVLGNATDKGTSPKTGC